MVNMTMIFLPIDRWTSYLFISVSPRLRVLWRSIRFTVCKVSAEVKKGYAFHYGMMNILKSRVAV